MRRLRSARFRSARRFWCRLDGHRWSAVRRHWFEDRYGPTGVIPEPGITSSSGRWVAAPNAALACMACGYLKGWVDAAPGTTLDGKYPVWFPPSVRYGQHRPTCPLCLLREVSAERSACNGCGVTDEQLYRARIASR